MLYNLLLLLPPATCIFWAVLLLLNVRRNFRAQNIWIATALIMSVSTFIWAVYFAGVDNYSLFYKLEVVEAFSTLLLLPMLYYCFRSLTNEKPFGWKEYIWLLPALLIGGSLAGLYISMGDAAATEYVAHLVEHGGDTAIFSDPARTMHHIISIYLYKIVVLAQIVLLLIYATVRLVRYRSRLEEFFSNLDGKSLGNYRNLLVGIYVVLALSLAVYRGRFHYGPGHEVFMGVVTALWCVIIYFMGYNVYRLQYTADELAGELLKADREEAEQGFLTPEGNDTGNDALGTNDRHSHLLASFEQLIGDGQIFLQSDLRLDGVARMLRTNRTYISRMINEQYGCSFSDYINRQRVQYAQKLIQANHGMTQEAIAERSGFALVTSFSRTFKQHTGRTFREWQRENAQL